MEYTADKKLPLYDNNYNNRDEKAKGSIPMYTSITSKSFSSSRIGPIKILILAIVFPVMILTIVYPMWICIFMKNPHLHPITPDHHNNVHTGNVAQTHAYSKSFKGGIKVTKETLDVIVASKDGHRLQELETTITVLENIQPNTNNKETTNRLLSNVSTAPEVKNNGESFLDRIRIRLFSSKSSCAYVALSVLLLCVFTIYGIACLSSDDRKMYDSVNNDDDENQFQQIVYTSIRDEEVIEKFNENNDVCVVDCSHLSTSPPPYPSNTNNELISTPSSENIQQSTDENQKTDDEMHQKV